MTLENHSQKLKKKQKVETVIAESDQKGKTRIEKTISLIPKKNKSKIFVDQIIPKKINTIPKKINSTPQKINSIPKKNNSIPKKNITKFKSTKSLLYNIPKPLENGLNGNTLFKEGNRDVGNEGISSDTTMKRHDVGENKSLLSNGDMQEKMNDNWPLQKDNEVELVISQSKSSSLPEQTSNEYKIYKELNKLLEIVTAPKIYDGSSASNINMVCSMGIIYLNVRSIYLTLIILALFFRLEHFFLKRIMKNMISSILITMVKFHYNLKFRCSQKISQTKLMVGRNGH